MTFLPFNDNPPKPKDNVSVKANYDTTAFDAFRQGVEITSALYLFGSSMPKLWAGNQVGVPDFTHQVETSVFGQTLDFVESNKNGFGTTFHDLPKFNAVTYIVLGALYPYPIELNDGPAASDEAILEPFTIPFRLDTNEPSNYQARQIHADMEEGGGLDDLSKSGCVISQFISYKPAPVTRFFLDLGGGKFGTVNVQQYTTTIQKLINPYDELNSRALFGQLTNQSAAFQTAIAPLKIDTNQDLRGPSSRSASAGYSQYGYAINAALYGTDSITYQGWSNR